MIGDGSSYVGPSLLCNLGDGRPTVPDGAVRLFKLMLSHIDRHHWPHEIWRAGNSPVPKDLPKPVQFHTVPHYKCGDFAPSALFATANNPG